MSPLIQTGTYSLWLNGGLIECDEVDAALNDSWDVSSFNSVIDIGDRDAIAGALESIAEHHPNERIWSESRPKI